MKPERWLAARCMLGQFGYTRASTRPHPCTHTPTRTHARTHTHRNGKYSLLFPQQQLFHKLASMLRYTYIAYFVITETECVYCAVRNHMIQVNINMNSETNSNHFPLKRAPQAFPTWSRHIQLPKPCEVSCDRKWTMSKISVTTAKLLSRLTYTTPKHNTGHRSCCLSSP